MFTRNCLCMFTAHAKATGYACCAADGGISTTSQVLGSLIKEIACQEQRLAAHNWLPFVYMSLPPLPACSRAMDKSQPDSEWNRNHKHWSPATVWAAQHAAREAQKSGTEPEGLHRCAACAADIKTPEKPKCSKCKLVSSGCLAKEVPMQKHTRLRLLL